MECPQCGYLMDAFQQECPKCARLGKQAGPQPAGEAKAPAGNRMATAAKDAASQFKAVPMIRLPKQVEEPELGWTLTGALWSIIVIDGLLLLACILLMILANISGIFLACISPIFSIIGAWALLTYNRWGIRFLIGGAIVPAVYFFDGKGEINIITVIFILLPAVAGVVGLVALIPRWHDFE